nr:hypothetical protein [Bacillus arachidis]
MIRAMKEHPIRTSARIAGSKLPLSALAIASYESANNTQKEILDNMPQQDMRFIIFYSIFEPEPFLFTILFVQ